MTVDETPRSDVALTSAISSAMVELYARFYGVMRVLENILTGREDVLIAEGVGVRA